MPHDDHHWTVSDRSIAFAARKWQVERSLRRRAGHDKAHEFFTIRIPDFVHVVPVTASEEIVMVRQFRHGIEAPTLEFPGGLLDPGESPMAAARRELIEETGYDAPQLVEMPLIHPAPALQNNRCWFYLAENARPSSATALEETEDVELLLIPRHDAWDWVRRGEITHATHLAALLLLLGPR